MAIEDCACMVNNDMFDRQSLVCQNCPWYYVAGAMAGHDFGLRRQDFMLRLIQAGHTRSDKVVVAAIAKQYGINQKAAALSFRRARRKWRDKNL